MAYLNSVKKWKSIEKNIYEGHTSYKSPKNITKEINEVLRKIKKDTKEERNWIKEKVSYEHPKASEEKIAALTYKVMENKINTKLKSSVEKKQFLYELSPEEGIIYGINNHRVMKGGDGIRYNSPHSLIRIKEQSNPKDYSLIHKFSQSPTKSNSKSIKYNFSQTLNENNTENNYLPLLTKEKADNKSILNSKMKTFSGAINPLSSREMKSFNLTDKEKTNISTKDSKSNPWLKYEYYHPGKWTKMATDLDSKKSGDQRLDAWSCCVSSDKKSQGCSKRVYNKMKWIYESFT